MVSVVALGDINVDIIAHFEGYPAKGGDALARTTEIHCGGSAANTAMMLARMGVETILIARVGPDSWALKALGCLEEAGVDPRGLQRDPAVMTGMMYVVVTPDGERTFLGYRGANAQTDPNRIQAEHIHQARLFHLSGYSLLADPQRSAALLALEIACRQGLTVALDPGMTLSQAALDEMVALLPVVDILLPNLREAQHMTGLAAPEACARALLDRGVEVVALKLGRDGCLVMDRAGLCRVPGFAVEARDSTGAGDCFAAGFIAGFLAGLGYHASAVLGGALGALTVTQVGAMTVAPGAQDVLSLLRERQSQAIYDGCQKAIEQVIQFVTEQAQEPEEEDQPWWK